jgi:hypothetical protein
MVPSSRTTLGHGSPVGVAHRRRLVGIRHCEPVRGPLARVERHRKGVPGERSVPRRYKELWSTRPEREDTRG